MISVSPIDSDRLKWKIAKRLFFMKKILQNLCSLSILIQNCVCGCVKCGKGDDCDWGDKGERERERKRGQVWCVCMYVDVLDHNFHEIFLERLN